MRLREDGPSVGSDHGCGLAAALLLLIKSIINSKCSPHWISWRRIDNTYIGY